MTNLIGANRSDTLTSTTLTQGKAFSLGDTTTDNAGNMYRFVQCASNATISRYAVVQINGSNVAAPLTAALALNAGELGIATDTAISSNEYGWVCVSGRVQALVGGSCNPNVPIYTTDTAGAVDDATASASQHHIFGLRAAATNSGATASNVLCVLLPGAVVVAPRAVGHS